MRNKRIICLCYDFPPLLVAGAIKIEKLLKILQKTWRIDALTSVKDGQGNSELSVHFVRKGKPEYLYKLIYKLRLYKLISLFVWPDDVIFWMLPAVLKARMLIKQHKPSAIVVFIMPYGAGIVGIILKWITGLPLVLNFDDSYTCTDMNPGFVTWFHYKMSIWLEDLYVRQADAVVYVSQRNLEAVKNRQPANQHSKFYLVRCGAEPEEFTYSNVDNNDSSQLFKITYIGAMVAWFEFEPNQKSYPWLRKLLAAWNQLGSYELVKLDMRSHSPVFIGKAVKQAIAQNPELQGKIKVEIYGSTYPKSLTDRVLESQGIADLVEVHGTVSHAEAIQIACQSDLLFLTLPDRPDGSPGGRISAKTYEYLMTDKPILAAVPQGENWDYLEDKPGVWLAKPTDVSAMAKVVSELASAKFTAKEVKIDRHYLRPELSYENRAQEFNHVIEQVLEKASQ
ncbi:glycosyltransferase [Aerosakkonemataceae cyanobacterium BLCC-F154]|uniref:Glycosyltransferase n=1 Tax=Floridaenema fluviatile BLCC-F154 TaxID=3153640 RepID=A0ABV4YCG1_9CYAN